MRNKRILNYEIMLTLACNMRCTYCFGKPGLKLPENKDGVIRRDVWLNVLSDLDNMREKSYYKGFDGINVQFFGGEPTLAIDKVKELLERYENRDDIIFKMVTNGQNLDKLAPLLDKYSSKTSLILNEPKFYIQISYDGNPIHDLKRVDINGKPTSDKVKEHIKYMQDNKLPYTLKSALPYDMFKYMADAYEDYLEVCKGKLHYFPTIDQSLDANTIIALLSDEAKEEYRNTLETSLLKIAKKEIEYYRKSHARVYNPRFAWFEHNKAICAMGNGYFTIATNGDIYPCHNTAYGSNVSKICTIFDYEKDTKIEQAFKYFSKLKYDNSRCSACDSNYCLKCPSEAFVLSKKATPEERYMDYGFNEFRCSLYKMASDIRRAIDNVL